MSESTWPPPQSAEELYAAMVRFAVDNGFRREELGSGWWWGDGIENEAQLGELIEELLVEKHGVDVRIAIPGEPAEYWG